MASIVGVRFKRSGPVQYYDPAGMESLQVNDYVVTETDHGLEIGWVVIAPKQVVFQEVSQPLRHLVRPATPEDLAQWEKLKVEGETALGKARELVAKHQLPMKLVAADYVLDSSRLVIQFGAEERVDFRQLLKDLGATFRTRVELRQIGPRDCARITGGVGRCGMALCCTTWLTEFTPVTVKMAKAQDLPIDIPALSGACGRLRCCLRYEYEQYRAMRASLPELGESVQTEQGPGVVVYGHVLRETVLVRMESQKLVELPLASITRTKGQSQGGRTNGVGEEEVEGQKEGD